MKSAVVFENYVLYEDGRLINKCGAVKKMFSGRNGYYYYNIGGKPRLVHRLLAENFIPNHDNLPIVDHINGITIDNSLKNLRWVSHSLSVINRYCPGSITYYEPYTSYIVQVKDANGKKKSFNRKSEESSEQAAAEFIEKNPDYSIFSRSKSFHNARYQAWYYREPLKKVSKSSPIYEDVVQWLNQQMIDYPRTHGIY